MKIHIKKTHIRRGVRTHFRQCALALAIGEQTGFPCRVTGDCLLLIGHKWVRIRLPEIACHFRESFDQCKRDASPIEFELEVPA